MHSNQFTVEQANAIIPWLESTLKKALSLQQKLSALQDHSLELLRESLGNGHKSQGRKVAENQAIIEKYQAKLERLVQDVTNKGVIVRDLSQGLVDFLSFRDNHAVYLCWRLGESEVSYWHDCDTGFLNRQPL